MVQIWVLMMCPSLGLTPGKKGSQCLAELVTHFKITIKGGSFYNGSVGRRSGSSVRTRLSVGITGDTLSWYLAGQTQEMQPGHPALKSINALNCQPGNSKGTFPKESIFIPNSLSS